MHIELDERRRPDTAKTMNLSRLDDQNVAWGCLEFLTIDGPARAPLSHEDHFVIGMSMRTGPAPGRSVDEKHRYGDVAALRSHELMGDAAEREVCVMDAIHGGHRIAIGATVDPVPP